ncbi:glycoside hydrolase family 3 protein [Flammeovirga sp. EKP202]|uniref:glycoside hydrolase family 3 protein n=1 Tax=Flammeovirga sp. EKP202 TaxID=2770592 RepID=UPI00165FDBB2|nr:glycoside hydrolase family 3 N-terminal domain-containing protein [Flammeovirga sp. EKP202]MBD0400762.1 glycoside hydrolase family 3 [Flammeovirga sp. EKP202]
MNKKPPFINHINDEWVKNTLKSMSLDQKIGQLFQVACFSNRDESHTTEVLELIKNYHLGGLTFFQGDAVSQASLTNQYQAVSKVPLFINIDAEWGLGMRLTGCTTFPYQMALGAIQDDDLIFQMGKQIAKDCKRLGVCSPLAPVVDVNNNPKNPVINYRSFGENKELVAQKGIAYMKGLQSEQVLDNAKHFPGHGDTSVDSHLSLPVLLHSDERLKSLELYPFEKLMEEGLSSVMTAHLSIPTWEKEEGVPVTLSEKVLSSILFDELGFEGLVITDALDMQGITNTFHNGEADLKAILAGNHIITNSQNVENGFHKIKDAIHEGRWIEAQLDQVVTKLLAMKKWVGLDHYQPIAIHQLEQDLHSEASYQLNQKLVKATITQIGLSPFTALEKNSEIAFLQIKNKTKTVSERDKVVHHLKRINETEEEFLREKCSEYGDFYQWNSDEDENNLYDILCRLNTYRRVIVSIHGINIKPFNHFDIHEAVRENLVSGLGDTEITLLYFGNAYALDELDEVEKVDHIFVAYQDGLYQQKAVFEALLGETTMGKLPVSTQFYRQGEGY